MSTNVLLLYDHAVVRDGLLTLRAGRCDLSEMLSPRALDDTSASAGP